MNTKSKTKRKSGGRKPKAELVMTVNCIYSRAYHAEMRKSGRKSRAQKKGQEAVSEWRAEM